MLRCGEGSKGALVPALQAFVELLLLDAAVAVSVEGAQRGLRAPVRAQYRLQIRRREPVGPGVLPQREPAVLRRVARALQHRALRQALKLHA